MRAYHPSLAVIAATTVEERVGGGVTITVLHGDMLERLAETHAIAFNGRAWSRRR